MLTELQEMYEGSRQGEKSKRVASFFEKKQGAQKVDSLKWRSHEYNKPLFPEKDGRAREERAFGKGQESL